MKRATYGAAALALLMSEQAAFGQSTGPTDGVADTAPEADQQEIIVTAQRRGEKLQDVPISITALSGSTLAESGIQATSDLPLVTPGLFFGRQGVNAQPGIRGIGLRGAAPGDEAPVTLYIDGVYQPLAVTNFVEFSSVEQIEVLKGPQGTLFGRNATGGAITIATKKPSETLTGDFSIGYGTFDTRKLSAYISGPLGTAVSANLSAFGVQDDGFVDNVFLGTKEGDRKMGAIRGKIAVEASSAAEFWLGFNYLDGEDNSGYGNSAYQGNWQPRRLPNPSGFPINFLVPSEPRTTAGSVATQNKLLQYGADLHGSLDLESVTLSGLVSGLRSGNHITSDNDFTPLALSVSNTRYTSKSYTQELILTSNGTGPFKWIAGVNGYQDNTIVLLGSATTTNELGQNARAKSVFGEATYEPLAGLFLTAGARYSWESRRSRFQTRIPTVGALVSEKASFEDFTPRFIARYQVAPEANVYASYSRGFKSGGFNAVTAAGARLPIDPEKVDAYEIGLKANPSDNVRFNAAAFYYEHDDIQVSVQDNLNGVVTSFSQNAAAVEIKGIEFDAAANLAGGFSLQGTLSYLDATITDFPNAAVFNPILFGGLPAGNVASRQDVSGNRMSRAPEWTASGGIGHTSEVAGGDLSLNADIYWNDGYFGDFLNRVRFPSYTVVNASASWISPGGWSIGIIGKNLTNNDAVAGYNITALGDQVNYQRPRSFLATFGYRF